MTVQTQIRIDQEVKKEANEIFSRLGLDMSRAVNLFLKQVILRGGLPFAVEIPNYNKETLKAMDEARKISRDSLKKGCSSMNELKASLKQ